MDANRFSTVVFVMDVSMKPNRSSMHRRRQLCPGPSVRDNVLEFRISRLPAKSAPKVWAAVKAGEVGPYGP